MNYVRAFAAGFVSTLVFHQGVLLLMQLAGAPVPAVWSMEPTAPLGVPKVISLAFWGGVWGIPIWYLMRHATGKAYWLRAIVFGAIGPTAVALLVVVPLKGGAVGAGWDPKLWIGGLIVNGAWGFGLALLIRAFRRWGF
jgi:hypothetical protein